MKEHIVLVGWIRCSCKCTLLSKLAADQAADKPGGGTRLSTAEALQPLSDAARRHAFLTCLQCRQSLQGASHRKQPCEVLTLLEGMVGFRQRVTI